MKTKSLLLGLVGAFLLFPMAVFAGVPGKKTVLREATVASISGTALTVSKDGQNYEIDTNGAKIKRKYNARASFGEIRAGDVLTIKGRYTTEFQIRAREIKDLSIQRWKGTFVGTVSSIDSANNKFVLASNKRGSQTVEVSSNTKFVYRKTDKTFADLKVGDEVTLKGTWNSTSSIIYSPVWVKIRKTAS